MSFSGTLIGTMLFTIGFIVSIYALLELLDEKRKQTTLLEEITVTYPIDFLPS